MIKITHNVASTRYARSSRRVKEVPLEDHVDRLAVPEDERPNVEGVLRALGRLPFNQRAALIMRELEGRSYGEIAETLNVSVAAVETLIFRARRSLRLRASALRSLGAVPLPASLAQLVEGGGVVAGGGVLLGSGFIFKAALALVAGALATGLGGGQQTNRVVAARPHVASNAVRGALPETRVGRLELGSRTGRPGFAGIRDGTCRPGRRHRGDDHLGAQFLSSGAGSLGAGPAGSAPTTAEVALSPGRKIRLDRVSTRA